MSIFERGRSSIVVSGPLTFERSNAHLKYGSSLNALCMHRAVPGMSFGMIGLITTAINLSHLSWYPDYLRRAIHGGFWNCPEEHALLAVFSIPPLRITDKLVLVR